MTALPSYAVDLPRLSLLTGQVDSAVHQCKGQIVNSVGFVGHTVSVAHNSAVAIRKYKSYGNEWV